MNDMKKAILLILLAIPLGVYAQKYVPFPTGNASWSEIHIQEQTNCDLGCLSQYKMIGDTIINSVQYSKIYMQEDTLESSTTAYYVGALREESKKIYFLSKYFQNEIRLYDFSKNVGDTLQNLPHQYLFTSPSSVSTIVKIDSMNINGSYRKVYYFDNDSHCWIEGIGNTHGLLVSQYSQPTCSCTMDLLCFHQNNEVIYLNPTYNRCFPSLSDGLHSPIDKKMVTVSPNPVKDYMTIQFNREYAPGTSVEIADVLGKRVETIPITNSSEYKLDMTRYAAGIYYVLVKYKDKTKSHKIIKM